MKVEILTSILNKAGVPLDTWTTADVFSIIPLNQDSQHYIHSDTERIKFNTTLEVIELVDGSYNTDGYWVATNNGATEDYTADSFIIFSLIAGFIQSAGAGAFGAYYQKSFI